ncbi:MAG: hypothetical protein M3P31_03720, partial [Actinomycetota bacterium]|nr:hypothetical protein [Actinomycetota bacterium]
MNVSYSRRVHVLMWSVTLLAAPLVAWTAWRTVQAGAYPLQGQLGLVVGLFALVLVAGEMWPIPVSRGEESS